MGRRQARRAGQANMLSMALKARNKNRRSLLAPYESAKKSYRLLQRQAQRRKRRLSEIRQKTQQLQDNISAVSERAEALVNEAEDERARLQCAKQLKSAVNRSVKCANAVRRGQERVEEADSRESWERAKKHLAALGTQLVDQVQEHERITESWMNIQFNFDRTTVGDGVRKLPGRIAYSPFTVYDPNFDHLDARRAASVSKK